jgi:DNA-binding transcriptional MocR family regulator
LRWKLAPSPGQPKYEALADAIAAEITAGRLQPGDRLPTQRDIAAQLGVTISTVTRAIGEAARRGHVSARTGSGTFVAVPVQAAAPAGQPTIDLSLNTLPDAVAKPYFDQALAALAAERRADLLFGYQPVAGSGGQRRALARWLEQRGGIDAGAEDIALTHGTQHALAACLAALTRPGDAVLCERWTYTGIRRLAEAAGVRLTGIAMDAHGLLPEDLSARLRATGAKLLICSAAGQNPTAATMPIERRREILAVCRAHDALVVEDDINARLVSDDMPPLAGLDPQRVVHASSLSKSLASGMRLGVLLAPPACQARLRDALVSQAWVAPAFYAELFARMVADGSAEACLRAQKAEAGRRQAMARSSFGADAAAEIAGFHLWLPVPPPWRIEDAIASLAGAGVRVSPANHFAVDDEQGGAAAAPRIRIALGAPEDDALLQEGLRRVAGALRGGPLAMSTIA